METPFSILLLKNNRWQNHICVLKSYCSCDKVVALQCRINVFALHKSNAFVYDGQSVKIYYINGYLFPCFSVFSFCKW